MPTFFEGCQGGKTGTTPYYNLLKNFYLNFSRPLGSCVSFSEVLTERVMVAVVFVVVPFAWTVGSFGGRIYEGVHFGGFHHTEECFYRHIEFLEVSAD